MSSSTFSDLIQTVIDKAEGWLHGVVAMLPNLVVAIAIVTGFFFLSRLASRVTRHGVSKVSHNKQVPGLIAAGVRIALITCGLFVALGVLKLDKTVTSLLAGVGVVGLAIGFAFQEIASNFIAGIILAIKRPFREGELVKISDFFGTIQGLTLRVTRLELLSGQMVYLPNKDVLTSAITNYSATGRRRVDVAVGVSYSDDLDQAQSAAHRAMESVDGRDPERDVEVYVEGFGGSSIDLSARLWIDTTTAEPGFLQARSEAVKAIKREFDEAGISIPFPIRTLDVPDNVTKLLARSNREDRTESLREAS